MTRKPARSIILEKTVGLRDRQRADGTWRLWWEPSAVQRAAGAAIVEFDPAKPAHASREAKALNNKWQRVVNGEAIARPAQGRSMNDLILDYRNSLSFKRLAENSRRSYGADLNAIAKKWGPEPAVEFDKPMVALWYEALHEAKGVVRSRAIFRMFSILMNHAELRGWRPENSNPCRALQTETPIERSRAASWAEVDVLIATARRLESWHVLTALYLGIFGGQRQTDVRLARPDDFYRIEGGPAAQSFYVWQLVQSKTKRALEIPIHTEAAPCLRMQLARAGHGPGTLIWDEATGKPFTMRRFYDLWDKVRIEAAKDLPSIATLQLRDLRRSFSNLSRAAGSTDADTGDVLGNTAAKNPKLRRTYMSPQLATAKRAVDILQRPKPKIAERKKA
jgi:integrase